MSFFFYNFVCFFPRRNASLLMSLTREGRRSVCEIFWFFTHTHFTTCYNLNPYTNSDSNIVEYQTLFASHILTGMSHESCE